MLPSIVLQDVGTPKYPQLSPRAMYFAAQYPARTYPYRRFTSVLADVGARLGASVAR